MLIGTGRKGRAHLSTELVQADVDQLFAALAKDHNDESLQQLPFCAFGFSVGSWFTQILMETYPERMIAAGLGGSTMSYIAERVQTRADDDWRRHVLEIPVLATSGELDPLAKIDYWHNNAGLLRDQASA